MRLWFEKKWFQQWLRVPVVLQMVMFVLILPPYWASECEVRHQQQACRQTGLLKINHLRLFAGEYLSWGLLDSETLLVL